MQAHSKFPAFSLHLVLSLRALRSACLFPNLALALTSLKYLEQQIQVGGPLGKAELASGHVGPLLSPEAESKAFPCVPVGIAYTISGMRYGGFAVSQYAMSAVEVPRGWGLARVEEIL